MAFKFKEAYSSDIPPDKNIIPTMEGTIVLDKATTVLVATASGAIVLYSGLEAPGVTILGFNKHPSKNILLSYKALVTAANTLSLTL